MIYRFRAAVCSAGTWGARRRRRESWTGDGWFRTGDAAVVDEVGYHRIVGRRSSDLIKSGGYRIGAGEVEAALLDHSAVAEAAVVGLPDPDLGQRIVAYVVADGARSGGADRARRGTALGAQAAEGGSAGGQPAAQCDVARSRSRS